MSKIANASINTFGTLSPKADVPQSEEPVFILTASQLKSIIQEANQPLQDEVSQLRAIVISQDEKITALESTAETQAENQLIQLRLINDLREAAKKEAQPLQKDRGEILRALIAANGGKMLAKEARQKMHLSRSRFSELLVSMNDYIDTKPYHLNKSAKILILK